jgi:hypothetical protein
MSTSTSPDRLTIDMTVMRDYLDPGEQRHQLAVRLFALARAGEVGLVSAPQGQRLDVSGGGELDAQLQGLVAAGEVQHAEQVSRLPAVTPFRTGRIVEGFDEAWSEIVRTWRTHEGRRPEEGAVDRFYVETHLLEQRDVFVTDDRALLAVCRRLRDEHGFAIEAASLADYLGGRDS